MKRRAINSAVARKFLMRTQVKNEMNKRGRIRRLVTLVKCVCVEFIDRKYTNFTVIYYLCICSSANNIHVL